MKSSKEKPESVRLNLSDSEILRALSDSQILKVKGERAAPDEISTEHWTPEVIKCYDIFFERAGDIRGRVIHSQSISPSPILSDLYHIINQELIEDLYSYGMFVPETRDTFLVHALDVTFTSLVVGKGLGYDIKMLLKLGLAAYLENVGMYRIPDSILNKKDRLGEKERAIIQTHPKESYKILFQLGEKRYRWLAEVALQVHERSDGSGYPNGLAGNEIYELSSIIGMVDIYTAMIRDRPHRRRFLKTEAIQYIVKESKDLFPHKVRRVFFDEITFFPVNTYVRLNNGSIGRVLSTNKKQALRPAIELIYERAGVRVEEREVIRLTESPLLYIISALDETELP